MEKRKARRKKAIWKRTLILILLAACIGASVCITAIPNGWKRVYAFFGLGEFGDSADDYPFSMHVLDVGKADAIFIRCGDSTMLVDCGMLDDGEAVAAYLQKRGVTRLDCAVATHPDDDHIGGYPDLLRLIPADAYIEPEMQQELLAGNKGRAAAAEVLAEKHILRKTAAAGDSFSLGEAAVTVLSPVEKMKTTNDSSLVLRITYGETSFLLMGDAGLAAEKALLSGGEELQADVLKVGHHGSKTSTAEEFLRAVSPAYAAVSVGPDRSDLPDDEVLQLLQKYQTETYRTDLDGTLIFASDGNTIKVITESG